MLHAIEQKSSAAAQRPKFSQIVQVSSKEEHERQALTLASFVQTMTDEFMSSFKFMNQQKK